MASTDALIGRVLDGKYRIDRLLGRGGMGEVYAGEHVRLDRPVAVKVLNGDLVSDEAFAARFEREARTAAKLEHPNAVHVYDFGSLEDGSAYLVMEFVEGVTLREVLRRNGPLPLGAVVDLMRQAGGAVGAAHARGIVHRDIKPENMMVRAGDDGRPVLKVVDFGLAKMLENQTSQLTNRSELIGTPKYMAPEQFSGDRVDERADVYALGCVLFEMLTGRPPFEGTFVEVVGKHVYAEVPALAALGVEAPPEVEAVVRRALAKAPAERIATAGDLVRELEAAAGAAREATANAITIPLPKAVPTEAQISELATGLDPDQFATRAADGLEDPRAYDTRFASDDGEQSTRVRRADPPTVVIPGAEAAADRATRALRPARKTFVDLEPPVATPPRRRPWGLVAVATAAAVLAATAASVWVATHRGPAPAPAPVVSPAPAPAAEPAPAPEPQPAAEPTPAAPKPATPKPAEQPRHAADRRPAPDEGSDVGEPEPPEPPEVDIDPDVPSPKTIRKLRRLAKELEMQQKIEERRRQRRGARPLPPPQP